MSLTSSLYAGASGMLAQEKATAIISSNVANMTTVGYKRSDAAFRDLVTTASRTSPYQAGGVQVGRTINVNNSGAYQQTSSTTNVAVVGNGFFAVRETTDPTDKLYFTRNGAFEVSADGILRNSAGFVAYGWALDSTGGASTTLTPVDTSQLENISLPTTTIDMRMNISATENSYNPHKFTTPGQLPVSSQPTHFDRTVEVYDTNGTARQLTVEFRKIVGPMAHFSSNTFDKLDYADTLVDNLNGPTPDITAGDTLNITDGTNTLDITFVNGTADTSLNEVNTVLDLINVINNFTSTPAAPIDPLAPAPTPQPLFVATLDEDNQLLVRSIDETATLDISSSSGTVLGNRGLNFIEDPDGTSPDYVYEPDADLSAPGTANPDQDMFPTLENAQNPYTWWEVTIKIPDPANPTGSTLTEISKGLINFNDDGTLNATLDANGHANIDMASTPIDFDSSDTSEDAGMVLNLANITQLSSGYTVITTIQDGAPIGIAENFEVTTNGTVIANFSNGVNAEIYRIPLAIFSNPNGLNDVSGTVFSATEQSGEASIVEAGTLGAGIIHDSTLEGSNVDIGNEFGSMIVSQRAYGLNGQIIQAVDEMTSYLVQLSR